MSVNVEFPDVLLLASREEPDAFSRRVRIYTLEHLYEEGKISSGLGAQVLKCTRIAFYCKKWYINNLNCAALCLARSYF